jgi:hypothetical protein
MLSFLVMTELVPFLDYLFGCLINISAKTGIHRQTPNMDDKFSDIQLRRCEYAAIYHLDKIYSTYQGQPPLVLRRFSNIDLPAAVTEAESYLRGQMLVAEAREEVLALIMGSPRIPTAATVLYESMSLWSPEIRTLKPLTI